MSSGPTLLRGMAKRADRSFEKGKRITFESMIKELRSKLFDAKSAAGTRKASSAFSLSLTLSGTPIISPGRCDLEREVVLSASRQRPFARPGQIEAVFKTKNEAAPSVLVIYKVDF